MQRELYILLFFFFKRYGGRKGQSHEITVPQGAAASHPRLQRVTGEHPEASEASAVLVPLAGGRPQLGRDRYAMQRESLGIEII